MHLWSGSRCEKAQPEEQEQETGTGTGTAAEAGTDVGHLHMVQGRKRQELEDSSFCRFRPAPCADDLQLRSDSRCEGPARGAGTGTGTTAGAGTDVGHRRMVQVGKATRRSSSCRFSAHAPCADDLQLPSDSRCEGPARGAGPAAGAGSPRGCLAHPAERFSWPNVQDTHWFCGRRQHRPATSQVHGAHEPDVAGRCCLLHPTWCRSARSDKRSILRSWRAVPGRNLYLGADSGQA